MSSQNEEGGWWARLPWQQKVSCGLTISMIPLLIYGFTLVGEVTKYSEFEVEGVIIELNISAGGVLSHDLTQITFENGSTLALDGAYDEFALGDNVWIRVGVRGNHSRVEEWRVRV